MLPLAELFVHVYVLVDEAVQHGQVPIPTRPGPAPTCSDSELLTLAIVRHLLARPSERAWLAELRANWADLFPRLPHQSEDNRRVRWLWGAFELLGAHLAGQLPADSWQQVDTSALPVKHPSRVRGPDSWIGPAGLVARLAGTPPTASGSTASALGCGPTWAAGWCAAGASCPRPWTSDGSPMGCWRGPRRRWGCCWTAASSGGPGRRGWPNAAPRSWWHPAASSGGSCRGRRAGRSRRYATGWRPPSGS